MKTNIARIAVLCILALATVNCERAATDSSRVSLQLPTYSKVESLTCTKCLKAVFVNVDGESFPTIKFFDKLPFVDLAATELSSEVVLDVPSGPGRKIQILAIYRLSDGTLEAQYGSVVADIFGIEPPPILLTLNNLGLFKGGSIVGRYLTGADAGPTGKVIISMNHSSGLSMDLFDGQILNGWFEFFMSENFTMSYRLEDGTPLADLQKKSLDNLTPVSGTNHIARFRRPSAYYRNIAAVWVPVNEYHDIIYGFFGDASAASKFVCLDETGPIVLPNMSSNGISANITYSDDTAAPNRIYGVGGIDFVAAGANCNSADLTNYSNNRINIRREQFDGLGNDTAKAMRSAFTYVYQSGQIKKYLKTVSVDTIYTFKGLPGLFATAGAIFDGAKVFMKSSVGFAGYDDLMCTDTWLLLNGFIELSTVLPTLSTLPLVTTDTVTFTINTTALASLNSADTGYIVCPTQLGVMTGLGGIYAGGLQ